MGRSPQCRITLNEPETLNPILNRKRNPKPQARNCTINVSFDVVAMKGAGEPAVLRAEGDIRQLGHGIEEEVPRDRVQGSGFRAQGLGFRV